MHELCAEEAAARRSVGGRHLSCITSEKQVDSQKEKKHTMPGIRVRIRIEEAPKPSLRLFTPFSCDST